MKSKKFLITFLIIFAFLLIAPSFVFAAEKETPFVPIEPKLQINIPTIQFSKITREGQYISIPYLADYIAGVYKYAVAIVSIIAIVMIMVGGLRWMTAGGNASAVGAAKEMISGATIGLLLVLGSYTVLYTINPDLVSFKQLQIKLIERQLVEYQEVLSDTDYSTTVKNAGGTSDADYGITGSGKPSKQKVLEVATKIAQEVGITDTCMFVAIVTKESGGDPGRMGHVENYQGPVYVTSRMKFLMSGQKYSDLKTGNKSFDPPFTTEAEYRADPAKYNKLNIKNDDRFDINNPPNYGLDWRFNHDFGLGQATLRAPSSDIPKLLTVVYNLKKNANLFKSNLATASKKYTGEDQLRAAYFAYAAGNGALERVQDKQTFYTNRASTRAMTHYNKCKSKASIPAAEPDPSQVQE